MIYRKVLHGQIMNETIVEKCPRQVYNKENYIPSVVDKEGGSMDLQDGSWRKPVIFSGVLLLLAGGAGAYYAGEAEEPPLVLQEDETQAAVPQEPPEIKGLQQAGELQALRNPFSLLHEREGEIAGQERNDRLPEEDKAGKKAVAVVSPEKGKKASASVKKETAPLILRGIVEGEGGRLALLQVGSTTVTAAGGESVAGWQVAAVGETSVTLTRAGQVRRLSLTMVQRGRKNE